MTNSRAQIPLAADSTIRILFVDDNPLDAGLCLRALRRAGTIVESLIVENEAELRAALLAFEPDIVLCDFSFPNFDGFAAQRLVRAAYPDCPLIFISGVLSEERAAMALQSGAVDYVMKSSLIRLPNAVERAVRTARTAALSARRGKAHVRRLEALWRIANDPSRRGADLSTALLARAAQDLRPGQKFRAYLSRSEGDDVVLVARGGSEGDPNEGVLECDALRSLATANVAPDVRVRTWVDDPTIPEFAAAGWGAVTCTHFEAGATTYWLTFASSEATGESFGDDDVAYLDVIAASLATNLRIDSLEDSLRDEESRSRQHAGRLEALWRIVNDASLSDADRWLAMLSQAAGSISPGCGYRGTLWSVSGETMTLEAVGESPDHGLIIEVDVGAIFPIAGTVVSVVCGEGGGTFGWDDVATYEPPLAIAQSHGAHSCIATTFRAGGATWALVFTSGRFAPKPLGAHERAYVEVLAAFFANHVQQRWQSETIQFQAAHDALTGLLSRSEFRTRASEAALQRAFYAIVIVDVDAFHEINETYGHATGDALLIAVARALASHQGPGDLLGRLGADNFALYLADPLSRDVVLERARALADVFGRPFALESRGKTISLSRSATIGMALAPGDGDVIDTVLSHADAALSVAKERGHGSLVAYEAGMEDDAQQRATLLNELAEAVARDQFELYFQPHVEIDTGLVAGCEALIRWNHPTRGLVSPFAFIPFAERTGIIGSIDTWVMRHAFTAAADLGAGRPEFRLYFNLSGRQAGDPKIVRAFVDAARKGIPLNNIGVEITETDAMRDVVATKRVFRALRRLDVRIAIDDFGTGYSSLSSLKQLSVDMVKIDRSFVSGVTSDEDDRAIAKTIISIADHFGFASLGEGAETPAEVAWLRDNACRYVQGYAISYPLPIDAFKAWLADHEGGTNVASAPVPQLPRAPRARTRRARHIPVPTTVAPRLWELERLAPESFADLPFGAIVVDVAGTIKSYNRYEAALSQLDATILIGKNFFRDVAPCTGVRAFEGRLHEFVAEESRVSEAFNYYFPFAHGAVDVTVRFLRLGTDEIMIAIERLDKTAARTRSASGAGVTARTN